LFSPRCQFQLGFVRSLTPHRHTLSLSLNSLYSIWRLFVCLQFRLINNCPQFSSKGQRVVVFRYPLPGLSSQMHLFICNLRFRCWHRARIHEYVVIVLVKWKVKTHLLKYLMYMLTYRCAKFTQNKNYKMHKHAERVGRKEEEKKNRGREREREIVTQ
jgi:hypothetical protein